MQNAMMVASIFGPFLMILGIWMLFYQDNLTKVCTSVKNTPGLLYVIGVINLLMGLFVLSQYSSWMWGLPFLVTLFGWVILIRGLCSFFIPHFLTHKKALSSSYLKLKGVILLVWGFGMCWLAFWMQ